MSSELMTRVKDKYVTVDGLRLRYIEEGQGPALLFLHGASLGSSADVFLHWAHMLGCEPQSVPGSLKVVVSSIGDTG